MYEQVGLQSYCYMMVYGAVLMFAIVAAVYLMLRQYNVISSGVKPPKKLTNRTYLSALLLLPLNE